MTRVNQKSVIDTKIKAIKIIVTTINVSSTGLPAGAAGWVKPKTCSIGYTDASCTGTLQCTLPFTFFVQGQYFIRFNFSFLFNEIFIDFGNKPQPSDD